MKRVISLMLCLAMVLSFMPVGAFAAEEQGEAVSETQPAAEQSQEQEATTGETEETTAPTETEQVEEQMVCASGVTISDVELPENGELQDAYVERLFYGGVSAYGIAAREQLNAVGQNYYDYLKEKIEAIAAGESASSYFTISAETLESWGLTMEYDTTDPDVAHAAMESALDEDNVMSALLHDCPYDLYWYDKTTGSMIRTYWYIYSDHLELARVKVLFYVAGQYQTDGYDTSAPAVDTSVASAAVAAAENAKSIVSANAAKSDYDKLVAYKNEICQLVTYNTAAAGSGSFSENSDPWQLVYVFDGDTSTNVVCEGYSKAFQYLCDLSGFRGTVGCHSVSGTMSGGTGAGAHMWNIVTIGGKHYLADVTNSDSGTVGYDGSLFLAGTNGSIAGGYTIGSTSFAYDSDTKSLWGTGEDSILNLAAANYDPTEDTTSGGEGGSTEESTPDTGSGEDSGEDSGEETGTVTSGSCGENTAWAFDEATGTLTISGSGEMADYNPTVEIPWSAHGDKITAIVIGEGVTGIGSYAFTVCTGVQTVSIPKGVSRIGEGAFEDCSGLTKLRLPESLSEIGVAAFAGCSGIAGITIPAGVTKIGYRAFEGWNSLQEIHFLGNAPEMEEGAFDCFQESVTISYPANNDTWTEEVRQQFEGSVTWYAKTILSQAEFETALEDAGYHYDMTSAVTLTESLTIDTNIYMAEGAQIIVADGVTLTVNGSAYLEGGSILVEAGGRLVNNGMLKVFEGSELTVEANAGLDNQNVVWIKLGGVLNMDGQLTGSEPEYSGEAITQAEFENNLKDPHYSAWYSTYGLEQQVVLTSDLTLDADSDLYISEGGALTVTDGVTLTIKAPEFGFPVYGGAITVEQGGKLVVEEQYICLYGGCLTVEEGGSLLGDTECVYLSANYGKVSGVESGYIRAVYDPVEDLEEALKESENYHSLYLCLESDVTLQNSAVIAENTELCLNGYTLTVPGGVTLTNLGTLDAEYGCLVIAQGAALDNQSVMFLNGDGGLQNSGTLSGDTPYYYDDFGVRVSSIEEVRRILSKGCYSPSIAASVVLTEDWTLDKTVVQEHFSISLDGELIIPDGVTLTVKDIWFYVNGGITILPGGSLVIEGESSLDVYGRMNNQGTVDIWDNSMLNVTYRGHTDSEGSTQWTYGTVNNEGIVYLRGGEVNTEDGTTWTGNEPMSPELSQEAFETELKAAEDGCYDLKQAVTLESNLAVASMLYIQKGGSITVPKGVTLTIKGGLYLYGSVTVEKGGILDIQKDSEIWYGSLTAQKGGTLKIKDGVTLYAAGSGVVTVESGATFSAKKNAVVLNLDSSAQVNGIGKSKIAGSVEVFQRDISLAAYLAKGTGYGSFRLSLLDVFVQEDDTLTIPANTTLYLHGYTIPQDKALVNNGTIEILGEKLVVEGTLKNSGTIYGFDAGQLEVQGKLTGKSLTKYKAATMTQAQFAAGLQENEGYGLNKAVTLSSDMTISGTYLDVVDCGSIIVPKNVTLTIEGEVSFYNFSTLVIQKGGQVVIEGKLSISRYAKVILQTGAELYNNGILNIGSDGCGTVSSGAAVHNYGTIQIDDSGEFRNDGKLYCYEDSVLSAEGGWSGSEAEEVEAYYVTVEKTTGIVSAGESSGTLYGKQKGTLTAGFVPGNLTNTGVVWSLADAGDTEYVTLTAKGNTATIVAKDVTEPHTVQIIAAAGDGRAEPAVYTLTVYPLVKEINVWHNGQNVAGKTITFDLDRIVDGESQRTMVLETVTSFAPTGVTWTSSNGKLATVEGNTVTFTGKTGTVKLTGTAMDSSGTRVTVTVKVVRLTQGIEMAQNSQTMLMAGKAANFQVVNSQGNMVKAAAVKWSLVDPSDEAYATITAAGKLTAKMVSETVQVQITANVIGNEQIGTLPEYHTVTIYPVTTQVEILREEACVNGKVLYLDTAGAAKDELPFIDLTAVLYPDDAYPLEENQVKWTSSNSKIATVDANGRVMPVWNAKKNVCTTGAVTITATTKDGSGKKAAVKIQVGTLANNIAVTVPANAEVDAENRIVLRSGMSMAVKAAAEYRTEDGGTVTPTVPGVIWSLKNSRDSAYVTLTSAGKITAKAVYDAHEVTVVVTSKDTAVSEEITLRILPKTEDILILQAENENVSGTIQLIDLANGGGEILLSAHTLGVDAIENVSWKSSNAKVISVAENEDGTATVSPVWNAKKNVYTSGTAVITATASDGRRQTVTVKAVKMVNGISVSEKGGNGAMIVASGKAITLQTVTSPADAAIKTVTWSIDPEYAAYATINAAGKLTATANLTAPVYEVPVYATAKDGSGVVGTGYVTILPLARSMQLRSGTRTLTGTTLTWDMGTTAIIDVSSMVYPFLNGAMQTVDWKSSNAKIADFVRDENGNIVYGADGRTVQIRCLKAGSVTITATAKDGSGVKSSFKLTVVKKMKSLALNDSYVVAGGKSIVMVPTIGDSDTTNRKVTWTLERNWEPEEDGTDYRDGSAYVTLSSSGKLTAKAVTEIKKVKVTVTAADGSGVSDSCWVYLYPKAAAKVEIRQDGTPVKTVKVPVGSKVFLEVVTSPEAAVDAYTCKSANAGIAAVEAVEGGLEVTGMKAGKSVSVTVTAADGSGKKATVKITVVAG